MDCKEALRWYERKWEEDRQRWEAEKKRLEQRLDEQAEEIVSLKQAVAEQEQQALRALEERVRKLEQSLREEQEAHRRCKEALNLASRPVLGADFFHHLAQALELWDRTLIEEARKLGGSRLEPWLKAIWAEREVALSRALGGEAPDWRRVRTGLVLEWALLTWLEGEGV
ncbi:MULTISPECIES: hypothetical protein [unclassified Meiothermus]|uniref:hypothetical protein n=1 Tax=unclassified Meiothermus TaxID=370471 RepID=UPI000D7BC99A|nr:MULTISPECIES: hypothetical protein [unclassified Meiothermus]PZA07722.1 hypothetical protein DNA98_05255 [Meiothermus sp. Pnk-1]RYM37491.1 hypothetical protein EWH23_06215 [Meiothermus sp. PNK-Is4]